MKLLKEAAITGEKPRFEKGCGDQGILFCGGDALFHAPHALGERETSDRCPRPARVPGGRSRRSQPAFPPTLGSKSDRSFGNPSGEDGRPNPRAPPQHEDRPLPDRERPGSPFVSHQRGCEDDSSCRWEVGSSLPWMIFFSNRAMKAAQDQLRRPKKTGPK